jgi:hypothetical protein
MAPDREARPWERAIHWTKAAGGGDGFLGPAEPRREAETVLEQILTDAALRGGDGFIKGGHKCVCFTEAPLVEMVSVFASVAVAGQPDALRYEPYGIGVRKEWFFHQGGRHVIYQPDNEYERLPEPMRWRHCRFEPPDIDFTWEREWRIATEALRLDPRQTRVFVPNQAIADRFSERHREWRIVPLPLFGLPNVGNAVNRREA